ncbi:hypothetical protein [Neobacillus sp. SAB-20_R2A]
MNYLNGTYLERMLDYVYVDGKSIHKRLAKGRLGTSYLSSLSVSNTI